MRRQKNAHTHTHRTLRTIAISGEKIKNVAHTHFAGAEKKKLLTNFNLHTFFMAGLIKAKHVKIIAFHTEEHQRNGFHIYIYVITY